MMDMPKVAECDVTECAYNTGTKCHALAITVGDDVHPMCDTFFRAHRHGGDPSPAGKVGACKVEACKYNDDYECSAPAIQVAHSDDGCADCQTYEHI